MFKVQSCNLKKGEAFFFKEVVFRGECKPQNKTKPHKKKYATNVDAFLDVIIFLLVIEIRAVILATVHLSALGAF